MMNPPTYTIALTADELDLLGRLLPEHPYRLVAPLIAKINAQIQAQLEKKESA